ncbi:uncharacterized protein TEOVI_000679900 [Trypanosoma equiperdum]|uniref:Uncharacterized protein n=1 Tax=Trypanosoma equiperdum TaxID=5694 RepID=A0A1G4I6U1_TRYEQ|nr:hypothetical protein, conserved [Trypanosoma equiperdum]
MYRFSISGSALPSSVDWALLRHLPTWRLNKYTMDPVKGVGKDIECTDDGPSPFWVSGREIRLLRMTMSRSSASPACGSFSYGERKSRIADKSKQCGWANHFVRWNRAISVFGVPYLNAADTSFCSVFDSVTCINFEIPLTEGGGVAWLPNGAPLSSSLRCFVEENVTKRGITSDFSFHSPYWLEVEGFQSRWPGVDIAPAASPLYVKDMPKGFINAEQTTDASRFDSVSCGPQRQHECLLISGVYHVSLNSSLKLADALAKMTKAEEGQLLLPPSLHETSFSRSMPLQGSPQCNEMEKNNPCNLWVDVEFIEAVGWSVHSAAVGVELHKTQLLLNHRPFPLQQSGSDNSVTLINAVFIVERDDLLNFITYKPDLIGFTQKIFIYSFTVIRLAFQAYKMKYTSTTWVVASALEGFNIRARKTDGLVGVEVKLFIRQQNKHFTTVVVNRDELNISDETFMELQQRCV